MSERKKILWLVSWYPNKYNLFDGDFVQRHAKAAALHHNIHVLFLKQHEEQLQQEEAWSEVDGLTEQLVYLPKQAGLLSKVKNYRDWKRQYKTHVEVVIRKCRPALIHVHVPWKVGLIAVWAKQHFKIPYAVTEHWGIYNEVVADNIHTKSFFFRRWLKRMYQEAAAFVSVSQYVGEGVNRTLVAKPFTVIPNVVDTGLFYPSESKYDHFTFIHVSNAVPLKNVPGILEAFSLFLQETGANARLLIVGNPDNAYGAQAEKFNLTPDAVAFRGEVPYADVAAEMRLCHAFVLASDIENSPCVIGEALCCGLPVMATAVGGIPELVNGKNGLLFPPRDTAALARAMTEMFQHYSRYHAARIALAAKKRFSPKTISLAFSDLYAEILNNVALSTTTK